MENQIQVFENKEFGKIRVTERDGQPWFVGKDVAVVLGYSNVSKAVSTHVDDEDRITDMIPTAQNGKMVSRTFLINESGLYSLILSSKLPNAKTFKRWVTSEVLPSIRRHGAYVFEYADTIDGRYNAKKPFVWEMKPEHGRIVIEAIDKAYDIDSFMGWNGINGRPLIGHEVGDVIFGLAHELSSRYYEGNKNDIGYSLEDSFLEGYDEYNISVAFRDALTVSAAYCIMTRCGIDPSDYIEDEDFQPIFDFNTPVAVNALGKATSILSQEVLREIEVTIKKYERERSWGHERTDIQQERGLSDTRGRHISLLYRSHV